MEIKIEDGLYNDADFLLSILLHSIEEEKIWGVNQKCPDRKRKIFETAMERKRKLGIDTSGYRDYPKTIKELRKSYE